MTWASAHATVHSPRVGKVQSTGLGMHGVFVINSTPTCQPAVGGMHCLLSAPLLQQRCCQDLVIFSSSIIESVLSKLVERLLTLLYIALLEIQKIALNCVNIVVLLFLGVFFLEVSSIYSVSVKGNSNIPWATTG